MTGTFGTLREGDGLLLWAGERRIPAAVTDTTVQSEYFILPSGETQLRLEQKLDPLKAPDPDPRMVGVMWKELRLIPRLLE